eukprot:9498765-Pyramimonas_sp.AAC.1
MSGTIQRPSTSDLTTISDTSKPTLRDNAVKSGSRRIARCTCPALTRPAAPGSYCGDGLAGPSMYGSSRRPVWL